MKKGLNLSLGTIILIFVLIVFVGIIAFLLTDGFRSFNLNTNWPPQESAETVTVKAQCIDACNKEDRRTYCCKEYEILGKEILCRSKRLNVTCDINCDAYIC